MPKSKPAKAPAKPKKSAPVKSAKSARAAKPAGKVKVAKSVKVTPAPRAEKAAKKPAKPAVKTAPKKAEKSAPKKVVKAEKVAVKKPAKTETVAPKKVTKANGGEKHVDHSKETFFTGANGKKEAAADAKLSPFLRKQKERLIHLRDNMLDSMTGVAKDTLRSRAEGSEASAFGMHQADAGSDAYDRDFALSLLSQEQDALYEIEEAIKRVERGNYGTCEMSGKPIAHARLEAIPFTRYTVECQSQLEKQNKVSRSRVPVTSLFGLTEGEETAEGEEEEAPADTKE